MANRSGYKARKIRDERLKAAGISPTDPLRGALTGQQMAVIDYFQRNNFTGQIAALKHAGYENPQWRAYEFFQNPKVRVEIERRRAELRKKYELDEDWVIQRLMTIADANLGDIMSKLRENNYDLAILTEQERYALGEYTEEVYMEGKGEDAVAVKKVKVKPAGKMEAIIALCRKLGLFNDKLNVEGEVNIVERLQAARKKFQKPEGEDGKG